MTKLAPLPQPGLAAQRLPVTDIRTGTAMVRIHWPSQALYFGPGAARRARGRFDSINGTFGTCYMAESTLAAFVETFLREGRVKLVTEYELKTRMWSRIEAIAPLRLVPCHGASLAKLHTTSAISSGAYSRSRAWSAAIHAHPDEPDGLRYRSRHNDDEFCIALFDRAVAKVQTVETLPLLHPATGVIEAINAYNVAVN